MEKQIRTEQAGFTLVEVLVALTIFAVGLLALAAMQLTAIKGNATAQVVTAKVAVGNGVLERIMALSGDENDDDLDIDGDGAVDFENFLTTPRAAADCPLSSASLVGAGALSATIDVEVDQYTDDNNSPDDPSDDVVVSSPGLTHIRVTTKSARGADVVQHLMKRRY